MPERKTFTQLKDAIPLPDLIEVQKTSYGWFFKEGLKELFDEISPIKDYIGRDLELYFSDYYLDEGKFDEVTAKERNATYEAPLRVKTELVNKKTGEKQEQEIYLGDFPIMTDRGTFVINGIERVVVSQLLRAPGVFFTSEVHKGKRYYGAKIIPNRGAWLEIETSPNNLITVKIDRKRKVVITSLLRALGLPTDDDIREALSGVETHPDINYTELCIEKDTAHSEEEGLKEVYKRIRPGDLATVDNARSLIHAMFFRFDRYDFGRVGRYKLNQRFQEDFPLSNEHRTLKISDLVHIIQEVIRLNISQHEPDDIDHLGNRRVRAV